MSSLAVPASPSIHIRIIYSANAPFLVHSLYMPKPSKRPFFNLTHYAYIGLAFFTNLNILHTIVHGFTTPVKFPTKKPKKNHIRFSFWVWPQRSHFYSIQSTLSFFCRVHASLPYIRVDINTSLWTARLASLEKKLFTPTAFSINS